MTKQELNQLNDLRREIADLKEKIERMEIGRPGSRIVSDKVTASSDDFPYTKIPVRIEGIEYVYDKRAKRRMEKMKALLQARKERAEDLELRITSYINGIEDSRMRRIIEKKYVEGYSWERVGQLCHCDRTTAEKAVAKYLRDHPEKN